jgi:hypothetical protein
MRLRITAYRIHKSDSQCDGSRECPLSAPALTVPFCFFGPSLITAPAHFEVQTPQQQAGVHQMPELPSYMAVVPGKHDLTLETYWRHRG